MSEVHKTDLISKQLVSKYVRETLGRHKADLNLWNEDHGLYVPSEPDPQEREITRAMLKGGIHALETLIQEFSL